MILRCCVGILILLGTYVGAVGVERVFSPRNVVAVEPIEVSMIDPWTKLKQELQSRRRARWNHGERLDAALDAGGYERSGVPVAEVDDRRFYLNMNARRSR